MILRSLTLTIALLPAGLVGQVATVAPESAEQAPADPADIRGRARDAQAAFERVRLRYAPLRFGSSVGRCDEYVGRFCTTYDEGDWYPRTEAEEVAEARTRLLEDLDALQLAAQDDGWILGQRVWYRADEGDWAGALRAASACGQVEPWWCAALRGFALHGLERYEASLLAFEAALDGMNEETSREWRVPGPAVDRDARRALEAWGELGAEQLSHGLGILWALADPLYLVEGNDRLTAHYARRTVSEIRRDARNPYGLSWSSDLEELTVRHGWELGYERTRSGVSLGRDGATGHKHPEGRDFLPSGEVLTRPAAAEVEDFVSDRIQPRSLYAPVYAPLFLPIESEIAVFPREAGAVIVATVYLPDDTTFHATHDHPRPWLEPGDQADVPDRSGVFALPEGGVSPTAATVADFNAGALLIELPEGAYVLSAESWSPSLRRAGRYRTGLIVEAVTPDVATASDLLLLRGGQAAPTSVEGALPHALVRPRIRSGDRVAIAWELSGLGFRAETLEYAVSVERTDRNVLQRIGGFLGLSDRPRPLALSWQEPAPEIPGPQFRHLDLDLPPLDAGRYEITLTLSTQSRSDVVVTRGFEVLD